MEQIATWLLVVATGYVAVGFLFAVAFVARGAERVDPQADGSSWGFRLVILPASAVLWPLLAVRWFRGGPPPEERNAHRERAGVESRR